MVPKGIVAFYKNQEFSRMCVEMFALWLDFGFTLIGTQ